jgi:hypothetical protein
MLSAMNLTEVGQVRAGHITVAVYCESQRPRMQAVHFVIATEDMAPEQTNPDTYQENILPDELPEFYKNQQAWIGGFFDRAFKRFASNTGTGDPSKDRIEVIEHTDPEILPKPAPRPMVVEVTRKEPGKPFMKWIIQGQTLEQAVQNFTVLHPNEMGVSNPPQGATP